MTITQALDLIKQGLTSHPNLDWNSRSILFDAVKSLEEALALSDKPHSQSQPAADVPTAQTVTK